MISGTVVGISLVMTLASKVTRINMEPSTKPNLVAYVAMVVLVMRKGQGTRQLQCYEK